MPEITLDAAAGAQVFRRGFAIRGVQPHRHAVYDATAFLLFVALAVIVWLVLRYTMFGRSLYAIGATRCLLSVPVST